MTICNQCHGSKITVAGQPKIDPSGNTIAFQPRGRTNTPVVTCSQCRGNGYY